MSAQNILEHLEPTLTRVLFEYKCWTNLEPKDPSVKIENTV